MSCGKMPLFYKEAPLLLKWNIIFAELNGMIKHRELGMISKHSFILLVLICLLGYRTECYAGFRTYTFKHLTENIALKQSHVNCIYQDTKGLMHFGTNEGLFLKHLLLCIRFLKLAEC